MNSTKNKLVKIGKNIVDKLLKNNEYRSNEITAGIDGERFHSYDTHKLVLLLSKNKASVALQIAAMGHDIDRIAVPGAGQGFKGKRRGLKYKEYKKQHAKISSLIIAKELRKKKIPSTIINRIKFLIEHHDDTLKEIKKYKDPELEILVSADSLSWLNFDAPNYIHSKETQGIPGLIDKMNFMLYKLPKKYWHYIPFIQLRDPQVLQYLKKCINKIAKKRKIDRPQFPRENTVKYKYCPKCTSFLQYKNIDNEKVQVCKKCKFIYWNNPKPVVSILLINNKGRILMIQRANDPFKDYWVLPGGFICSNETPEQAILRETKEETGFTPQVIEIIGAYKIDNDPRGVHIDIIYKGKITEPVVLSDEHKMYKFFNPKNLPEKIAYKHRNAITDWFQDKLI